VYFDGSEESSKKIAATVNVINNDSFKKLGASKGF